MLALLQQADDPRGLMLAVVMLIPVAAVIGICVCVAVWLHGRTRRAEAEAFYRAEVLKKLADRGELTPDLVAQGHVDGSRQKWRAKREGFKLGGLLFGAVGAALLFFGIMEDEEAPLAVGVMWFLSGLAFLVYGLVLYPDFEETQG